MALVGAMGIVVPALLALPNGRRHKVALIQSKAEILSTLPAEETRLRERVADQIRDNLRDLANHEKYGSKSSQLVLMPGGMAMITLAIAVWGADGGGELNDNLRVALCGLVVGWGCAVILYAAVNFIQTLRGLDKEQKALEGQLGNLQAENDELAEKRRPVAEVNARADAVRRDILLLEAEVQLQDLTARRDELAEKVAALREAAGPEPAEGRAGSSER